MDTLESLLNHPTPVHLQCEVLNSVPHTVAKLPLVLISPKFKKLLNDVISKYVSHQLVSGVEDFGENFLLLGGSCSFKFLLNEPANILNKNKFEYKFVKTSIKLWSNNI